MAEKKNEGVDLPESAPSTAATNTTPPASGGGYEKCSLCNNIIEGEARHILREHPHVQHLHDMVARPIPPLPIRDIEDATAREIGSFVVATSIKADLGESAFRVLQRAQAQINCLLEKLGYKNRQVYLFGSAVSMGSWDGVSDGDFSFASSDWCDVLTPSDRVVTPVEESAKPTGDDDDDDVVESDKDEKVEERSSSEKSDAHPVRPIDTPCHVDPENVDLDVSMEKIIEGLLPSRKEKKIICEIAARLRNVGFLFRELEPVLSTRIPILRREQICRKTPLMHPFSQMSTIRFRFNTKLVEKEFRRHQLQEYISTYKAKEVPDRNPHHECTLVLRIPDSTDAIRLMSRRERLHGVRKYWLSSRHTPEIFAIDFDISCRHHGVRNSWLLRHYLAQNEVFRIGYVFLKMWSKACGVNNPRIGFLTSYSISVLWIYFLLHCDEAQFVNPADIPPLPNTEKQTTVPYIPLWSRVANVEADAARMTHLGNLVRGFFYFYGQEFDWNTHVVTLRQSSGSGTEPRTKKDLGWETSNTSSLVLRNRCYHILCIEDVYEHDLDLGRHLSPEKAAWTLLQFRLAYQRCCLPRRTSEAGEESPLWTLLDTPQKRAKEVLHTRLYRYLLCDTEDAAAPVAEIVENLGVKEELKTGRADWEEDPLYLLCAYELGNRLCDLWFDHHQVLEDTALHKKHDRCKEDYIPPKNPIENGEWAAVCTDDLYVEEDPTVVHHHRSVHLVAPLTKGGDPTPSKGDAPERLGALQLIGARHEYEKCVQELKPHAMGQRVGAPAATAGVPLHNTAFGTLIPHCFYTLKRHRLFETHEARETFARCVKDVVRALEELHDSDAPAEWGVEKEFLRDREKLFHHLEERLYSSAIFSSQAYKEVLEFLCLSSETYICSRSHPYKGSQRIRLGPTRLLLSLAEDSDDGQCGG
ncbi:hypothetical protein JKF63_05846 [Porcisia hertigi]|uniref:RNA uridylyltransferase n=1 Tax=Porcisia hertigi TaxID=2761500 RepID=A0A836IX73_9TRYP|nr:hypothetical protein JKF63_05846 [Porcisia hertigi]